MKRRFRLTCTSDFERVRRTGKSFPHSLLVLVALENQREITRVGIAVSRSVGGAVVRNRAKRLIRAALHPLMPNLAAGWDLVLIARRGLPEAGFWKTRAALENVIRRAGIMEFPEPGYDRARIPE